VVDTSLEEGREEGRKEGIEQVAKNMKLRGLSIVDIMELTGLNKSEIQRL